MKKIKDFKSFFLAERRIETKEILSNGEAGLVLYDGGRGVKEKSITLYDFKEKKVLGFIQTIKKSDEPSEITKSAAEKGYGPSMYDFALMSVHPEGLVPDRESISEAALNIWRQFFNNRDDVKKEQIKEDSIGYIKSYQKHEDSNDTPSHKDDEGLKIMNTKYYLAPSLEYEDLLKRGKEIMERDQIKPYNITKLGSKYFTNRYY